MNSPYSRALQELRSQKCHELKEVGDQWRTPDLLFWGINAMFGPLLLDLFADDSNAKCPVWYTAEDNALTQDWAEMLVAIGGAAFGNPPYSRSQYHEKQAVTGMSHQYATPEAFPWAHDVMYWVVLDVRHLMHQHNYTEAEVLRSIKSHMRKWERELEAGRGIPKPVMQLADKRRPPAAADIIDPTGSAEFQARIRARQQGGAGK